MNTNDVRQSHTGDTKPRGIQSLKDHVLARIERDRVEPESRFACACRQYGLIVLWVLTIFLGAEAVAAILFTTSSIGWEFYEATHENLLTFMVEGLPYVWILLLCAMIVLGYYNFRQTKGGYRYPLSLVILMSVGGSMVGGITLHSVGAGYVADEFLGRSVPLYRSTGEFRESTWMRPEHGLFGGTVRVLTDDAMYAEIMGIDGNMYTFKTYFTPKDLMYFSEGDWVHIIAVPTTTTQYIEACAVLPWEKERQGSLSYMVERRSEFISGIQAHATSAALYGRRVHTNPCRKLEFFGTLSEGAPS